MAHVEKRGPRKYRARYRGPDGKERSKTFTTERESKAWLASMEHSKTIGAYVAPERSRMTVGNWGEAWLAGRVDLKPKTVAGYESLWQSRIRPRWENVSLDAVSNADVAAWVAKMTKAGLSASRVRQAFHLFGAMLGDAVRDRRLASNPAAGVKLPRMPQPEKRYLTHQQLAELADACGPYRTLVLVLGYCGLRWGEAAALRVGRVDVLRGRLHVAESMTEVNGRAVFGPPKTHERRSVPVPISLRDDLARACADKGPDDFLFPSKTGCVLRDNNFRRAWFDAAVKGAGLEGFTPKGLRDAAASFAIASGASVKGVQSMLGHRSASMTLDRYAALWPDELDTVAERIDAARIADNSRPDRGLSVVPLRATNA
jgi:integrase